MSQDANEYNMIVIGGGSAGLVSAYIAATLKAKVILIERHKMGGDCLNTGCIPSKALIKTAKVVQQMREHQKYGIKSATFEIDFAQVMDRVQSSIARIEPHDSVERYEKLGVECLKGEAEILDAHTVRVGERTIRGKTLILALGARPALPPIKGIEGVSVRTSENLWDLRERPKKFLVLGGGLIGCEMAQAFQRLGSSVTLVEAGSQILPREDSDVADMIAATLKREGITLELSVKAKEIVSVAGSKELIAERSDGTEIRCAFDEIFVATGRKPNTDGIDWSRLGVELNQNGTIKVDSRMRANGKGIYACGDVAGPYQFTHMASHQAWYCAVNAIFSPLKTFEVDYRVVPWVTFTDPEIAQVGHNERSARAAGLDFETTIYSLSELDRAITESEAAGQVKVLTVPGKDTILGASIVGSSAGEMLIEFITAMKQGLGMNDILGTIHPYPTFGEANKFAAGNWKKAHAPEAILRFLEKFQNWRR